MLRIWLEHVIADDGTPRVFAHIEAKQLLGKCAQIRAGVPKGAWVTVPPELAPAGEWLVRKAGFQHIGAVDIDGIENAVLEKVD